MNNKALIIGLAAIAVIGIAVLTMGGPKNTQTAQQTTPTVMEATAAPSAVPTEETGPYKSGKYTAEGGYTSPAQPETVTVDLALASDGTITDVNFKGHATNATSIKLQGMFASGYKELVIGKKIDEVQLDKVSGSSLTPMGFNDAIEKIKVEAARG
jgi:hypothetical protein